MIAGVSKLIRELACEHSVPAGMLCSRPAEAAHNPCSRADRSRISVAVAGAALIACALGSAVHGSPAEASTYTLLHSFGSGTDGQYPWGAVLINAKGTLYGTTFLGGTNGTGTVYSLNPTTGAETMLYSFGASSTDGKYPEAAVTIDKGTFYGTTAGGGINGVAVCTRSSGKTTPKECDIPSAAGPMARFPPTSP